MRNSRLWKTMKPKLKEAWNSYRLLKRNTLTRIALYLVFALVLIAIFAPVVLPSVQEINEQADAAFTLQAPSAQHLFGTDELGRDIFLRTLIGTRVSLGTAVICVAISVVVGVILGATAGYFGGVVDDIIMRITDMFLSFPSLLLAMAVAAILGPSLQNAIIAIVISWWPSYTRIVRGQAVSVKERQFVKAAKAIGTPNFKIITSHVIPNCLAPVIVQVSMDLGNVIMTLASLSFLGLGAQSPTPEWGLMVSTSRNYFLNAWWYSIFPGLAIFVTVLAFNLVGDGLREILDPKTKKK